MHEISKRLQKHYDSTFEEHGANSSGVDWGENEERLRLRYQKMLAVITKSERTIPSLLDVGCGFGGFFAYIKAKQLQIKYSGIDVSEKMIHWGRENYSGQGDFVVGDVLDMDDKTHFDYMVCNGILTQKLETEGSKMDAFANQLIRKMFSLCRVGVAFNVMTSKVNFYANNLYYRNPAELLAWCMSEVTPYIKLDHSYPLYEYTVYLYREPL